MDGYFKTNRNSGTCFWSSWFLDYHSGDLYFGMFATFNNNAGPLVLGSRYHISHEALRVLGFRPTFPSSRSAFINSYLIGQLLIAEWEILQRLVLLLRQNEKDNQKCCSIRLKKKDYCFLVVVSCND